MIVGKIIATMKPFNLTRNNIKFSNLTFHPSFYISFTKRKINSDNENKNNSRWWIKYALCIPLVSGIGIYQYTKYKFLRYEIPE